MTFDGYPWGGVAMLLPQPGHPKAAATADALTAGLAGAYGFRRTAARQVGQALYTGSPARLDSIHASAVLQTSPVGVAEIEGYVPAIATRLEAEIIWICPNTGQAVVAATMSTSADSSPTRRDRVQLDHGDDLGTLYRGIGDEYAEGRIYATKRTTVSLDLQSTTLDTDVVVSVQVALTPYEERDPPVQALALFVSSVSVVWVAEP